MSKRMIGTGNAEKLGEIDYLGRGTKWERRNFKNSCVHVVIRCIRSSDRWQYVFLVLRVLRIALRFRTLGSLLFT
jgi:hypothetical protein